MLASSESIDQAVRVCFYFSDVSLLIGFQRGREVDGRQTKCVVRTLLIKIMHWANGQHCSTYSCKLLNITHAFDQKKEEKKARERVLKSSNFD